MSRVPLASSIGRWFLSFSSTALLVVLAACAPQTSSVPVSEPPPAPLVALPESGIAIVVAKSRRTLTIVRDGVPTDEFPIVIGRQPVGAKRYEGDMRTPEGLYRVVAKRPHERWRYFIGIDYPNDEDITAYTSEIASDRLPVFDGEFPGIGGHVGIHGSDRPLEQASGTDWTLGCVAMHNGDVDTVYEAVSFGTLVLILP